jgi:hypothetical protein
MVGEAAPDTADYAVTLQAVGSTPAAAQAALGEQEKRLAAQLAALGVAAEIAFTPGEPRREEVTVTVREASVEAAARRMAGIEAEARRGCGRGHRPDRRSPSASGVLRVTLRDLARQEAVQGVLGGGAGGFAITRAVRLYAADPARAHQAALAQALGRARAEADAYAAALGWHILRIERVSNARPALSAADLIGTLARVDGAGRAGKADIAGGHHLCRCGDRLCGGRIEGGGSGRDGQAGAARGLGGVERLMAAMA